MRLMLGRMLVALTLLSGFVSVARAELERVGPVSSDPTIGGFPAWYQDRTGLALEFCAPSQAEIPDGWCLLLPGDANPPESFPDNFADEHFWFAADASVDPANGGKALLVIGLEAAFAVGPPVPGDQVAFGRIRVRLDPVPATGTYRFIHPYGEDFIQGVEGERIFFTEDIGITCAPGDFSCALQSRVGPFLLPSDVPGGAEQPAVVGPTGKLHIADPGREGPVTGSALPDFEARANSSVTSGGVPTNHNIFRIEGPPGSNLGGAGIDFIETTAFTLMGRIFTGAMPGRVSVDRASYTANAAGQKVDVFATGLPTTQGRLPAQPRPAAVMPVLSFFDAACASPTDPDTGAPIPPFSAPVGATETPMVGSATHYWGQIQPASPAAIPTAVCVKDSAARDAGGAVVPTYETRNVTDDVSIALALFDPSAGTLSVAASSTDELTPPTLTLGGFGDLVDGSIVVTTAAPPAKVRVLSNYGGANEFHVTTGFGAVAPPAGPVAVNDGVTFDEDSGAQTISILDNDSNVAGGTVTLVTLPRLGTATIDPAGATTVTYTPNPNANGLDGFTYSVTVGGVTSNVASVSINLAPVNDAPVANNDGPYTVLVGASTILPNLLANDTDPDGAANLSAAANLTAATPPTAVVEGGANGFVTFTAAAAGTYTFTYQAQDAAGALSANAAQVTVNAVTSDVVTVTTATFRTDSDRWIVAGTDSVPNQTITISYADGPAVGSIIGTAQGDAAGNWVLDIRGVTGARDPTTLNPRPTQIRATSALGGTAVLTFTTRR